MNLTRRTFSLLLLLPQFAGCSSLGPLSDSGQSRQTLTVDGRLRSFVLHEGPGMVTGPRPLLLVFHGLGGSSADMQANTGLDGAADHFGFLVAYLDAAPGTSGAWALDCHRCTNADTLGVSDLIYVDSVIAHVSRSHAVDATRIYATGFSLGSYMTQVIGCKRSGMIAAMAGIGGHMNAPMAAACPAGFPVPALIVTGLADNVMPWSGTTLTNGTRIYSSDSTAAFWAARNGCVLTPRDSSSPGSGYASVSVRVFDQCAGGAQVQRWGIEGLGHTWPRTDPFGTRDIVQFLLRFRRGP